jgi:hypothetical protein
VRPGPRPGCCWVIGRYNESLVTLHRSVEAALAGGNQLALGFGYFMIEYAHHALGNYDEAAVNTKALEALERHFDLHFYMYSA